MLCKLSARFDPSRDVGPWLSERPGREGSADAGGNHSETLHIINVERNGNVLYTWKGPREYTNVGLYDNDNKNNQHLYTFEKDLCVISCSVNHEKTLLAISFLQTRQEERKLLFQTVPKCLTLLIEIHPLNNVKVLKAVDSCIRVQFLYPLTEKKSSSDSCLLLISEDKYAEKLDIKTVREGDRVTIENSNRLLKERIVDDLIWSQWDMVEQRLFYIVTKEEERDTLHCIQFYPDKDAKLILEAPLEISMADIRLRSVNLNYSYYQDQETIPKPLDLHIFTSDTGSLCLCYSLADTNSKEVSYSVAFLHKGYSKTYIVTLEERNSPQIKELVFLDLGSYVAVYLPGQFLHLLDTQHPSLICHSFFLSGEEAKINPLNADTVFSPAKSSILDRRTGKIFTVEMSPEALLQFLWKSKSDNDQLAALHCLLLHVGSTEELEDQIIQWLSENASSCFAFDPIQEVIIASLHWKLCLESSHLDKLLLYTSLPNWKKDIPGILCEMYFISLPSLKVRNCKGFWEKLNLYLEYVKYFEPPLDFSHKVLRREWFKLLSDETAARTSYLKSIFENTKKVLSSLHTWETEERIAPLFQDEDYQQSLLTGLMVAQLKEHLLRPLRYVGQKKIDQIAVDYVSKLLDLICRMMENVQRKCSPSSLSFSCRQPEKANEVIVFHIMCRILQAASGMCLPLPPGFHTRHLEVGMRCFPLHTVLQYIDHGVLHLTEKYVLNLWKESDNTEQNMKLKLSILARLPQAIGGKVCQLWNHPLSTSAIARNYVKLLLEKLRSEQYNIPFTDRISTRIEFLPLNYLVTTIVEMERQGWAASLEETNMNARMVEEVALKHTTMLLGLF
ncbi:gamma-secretase-activating protein-like isoform X4 [Thamnophis elegans]|uniref:gamma-secretase-activating protein-like isoform X4 n=1 Tax=Thamnophis elegans TaxID=35005 RepID=UPI0013767D30|nr:gamma-secretase-activating protein-like isoform X4 [Thamnophis elegans]